MKKTNYVLILIYIVIIPFMPIFFSLGDSNDKTLENELKRNINEVVDLSDITITGFEWKHGTKDTLGVFKYIEIKNASRLGFKNLKLNVYIYDKDGTGYKFLLPIKGEIGPGIKKKFSLIRTPILQLTPETTDLVLRSAELVYEKDNLKIKAANVIKINEFKYIVDNTTSKIIQVEELSYVNQSKSSFKELIFSVNFFDAKGALIKSVNFKNKGMIGPNETRIDKNFQIPGIDVDYFSDISLSVFKGKLISDREYLGSEENRGSYQDSFSTYDTPLPSQDLVINDFNVTNSVRNTIGKVDINLSNTSRYQYKDIVVSVQFVTSSGNTITSKKIKINDSIQAYTQKTLSNNEFGLIDNEFDNFRLSILSATMVDSVSQPPKAAAVSNSRVLINRGMEDKEAPQLVKFDANYELLILNSDINTLSSVKVLNVSDKKIFNPTFELILLGKGNEVVGTILLNASGPINSKKERTFRSIEIANYDSYDYENYTIKFVSGEKLK